MEVGFLYLVFRFQHTPGLQPVDRGILAKVEEAKNSGFVAELIQKHGVEGRLAVAPLVSSM